LERNHFYAKGEKCEDLTAQPRPAKGRSNSWNNEKKRKNGDKASHRSHAIPSVLPGIRSKQRERNVEGGGMQRGVRSARGHGEILSPGNSSGKGEKGKEALPFHATFEGLHVVYQPSGKRGMTLCENPRHADNKRREEKKKNFCLTGRMRSSSRKPASQATGGPKRKKCKRFERK